MKRGISVIICCYDSAWVIRRTLEALKAQQFRSAIPYEIVLVDNRCTDDTVEVAEDTMKDSEIDFHIIREDVPGLANARRKGINEVKYEYVLYCDDDNLLCPDYVYTMVTILDCMPDVGAVGGKGIAEFEVEPADVVKENLTSYAVGSQLGHGDWLFGAGMALRTALVRDVYNNQKCYLLGRRGEDLCSGDDFELVMSILLRGFKIHALDEVWYIHVLKAERLTEEYFNRLSAGLALPTPVFDVMRAALYGKGFYEAIKRYWCCYKRMIKYTFLFWKSEAVQKQEDAKCCWAQFRYWGVLKLHEIYCQCVRIKKASENHSEICEG